MIRVCSGYSPSGRELYGNRFLETFNRHWPLEVDLKVYVEERHKMPRDACRLLWDIPGATDFRDRHKDNLAIQGRVPTSRWKRGEIQKGYSFRTDAYRFWKQLVIPQQASLDMADGDILVWLDGDVVTTRDVPLTFIPELLGKADVSFLDRENSHPEIGYWSVKLSPVTRLFLANIADIYMSDDFMQYNETHSAFLWNVCRLQLDMRERNLTPPGAHGHVWPRVRLLSEFTNHLKGPRKGKLR